jgi:hypothetical protein
MKAGALKTEMAGLSYKKKDHRTIIKRVAVVSLDQQRRKAAFS